MRLLLSLLLLALPGAAHADLLCWPDLDQDGFGDAAVPGAPCGGSLVVENAVDCDDSSPTRSPMAEEVCDGLDNDCDGVVPSLEQDADGDGVPLCGGDCDDTDALRTPGVTEACDGADNDCDGLLPQDELDLDGDGSAACAGDCDDSDPGRAPGLPEVCDGSDNDCSGSVDPSEADGDGDGVLLCAGDCDDLDPLVLPGGGELCDGDDNDCDGALDPAEVDNDADGVMQCAGDCDDASPARSPMRVELCDGIDNDCDGAISAPEADADGDGAMVCAGDCNDGDATVGPGAAELCDGIDNDCSGGLPAAEQDLDADGTSSCAGDCDEADATIGPGAVGFCDGVDTDCDGALEAGEVDADGDGVTGCGGDCDDADPTLHPFAGEQCDGIDNNCDGVVDPDLDGDGVSGCSGDCDDGDVTVFPGAPELCNGVDDDCDGSTPSEGDVNSDGLLDCDALDVAIGFALLRPESVINAGLPPLGQLASCPGLVSTTSTGSTVAPYTPGRFIPWTPVGDLPRSSTRTWQGTCLLPWGSATGDLTLAMDNEADLSSYTESGETSWSLSSPGYGWTHPAGPGSLAGTLSEARSFDWGLVSPSYLVEFDLPWTLVQDWSMNVTVQAPDRGPALQTTEPWPGPFGPATTVASDADLAISRSMVETFPPSDGLMPDVTEIDVTADFAGTFEATSSLSGSWLIEMQYEGANAAAGSGCAAEPLIGSVAVELLDASGGVVMTQEIVWDGAVNCDGCGTLSVDGQLVGLRCGDLDVDRLLELQPY